VAPCGVATCVPLLCITRNIAPMLFGTQSGGERTVASYGGCSTGLGTSASWNVSTTLTRLIGAHDTTKTHSCTRKASQRGHRLPASSTSGLGRGLAAERDHFWASMRNHPVQRPVGRVPSNFERPGDQIYMVPSNFCDWISLFHQIMVAVT